MIWFMIGLVMANESLRWSVVNDTVMGGRSTAQVSNVEEGWGFEGNVSLENNGGFASIRTRDALDLSPYSAVDVQISGTETPVQFVVWIGMGANLYYAHEVLPMDEVQTLDFSEFVPRSYGRQVRAPSLSLQPRSQVAIGFLVGDGYAGEFKFNIGSIEFIETENDLESKDSSIDVALIRAIERGVPIYNSGNPSECAAIYQTVLEDILLLHPTSLTSGQQRQLQELLQTSSSMSADSRAWAYRTFMDQLLAS